MSFTLLRFSLTLLRFSLTAILCCATLHSGARAAYAQNAPPRPMQEGVDILAAAAVAAENKCERGAELSKNGDTRGAVEALGEAVELYKQLYADARAPKPESAASVRSDLAARLRRAPECVELYARLGGPEGATDFERGQLEALRAHAAGLTESDASRVVYFAPETYIPALIVSKPEPRFPRGERERGKTVSVTVVLRVVLSADGEARDAFLLKGSPDAFAESCVEAAKRVQFRPAVKEGRQVSQFITLEYNFRTY